MPKNKGCMKGRVKILDLELAQSAENKLYEEKDEKKRY